MTWAAYIAGEADDETRRRLEGIPAACAAGPSSSGARRSDYRRRPGREELQPRSNRSDCEATAEGITEQVFRAETARRTRPGGPRSWGGLFGCPEAGLRRTRPRLGRRRLAMYVAFAASAGPPGRPAFNQSEFLPRWNSPWPPLDPDYLERSSSFSWISSGRLDVGRPPSKRPSPDLLTRKSLSQPASSRRPA